MKALANAICELVMLPLAACYQGWARLMPNRRDAIFQGFSQLISLLPGFSGIMLRRAFYRWTLLRCPRNCSIGFGTLFATADVVIGDHVYIGARCMLGHVDIGPDVLIGSNVDIMSGARQHHFDRLDIPVRLQGNTYERVSIGADVWIGNGAIVMTNIGAQAVVAAGAVVAKPVPEQTIVGGNPARVIRRRVEAEPPIDHSRMEALSF